MQVLILKDLGAYIIMSIAFESVLTAEGPAGS